MCKNLILLTVLDWWDSNWKCHVSKVNVSISRPIALPSPFDSPFSRRELSTRNSIKSISQEVDNSSRSNDMIQERISSYFLSGGTRTQNRVQKYHEQEAISEAFKDNNRAVSVSSSAYRQFSTAQENNFFTQAKPAQSWFDEPQNVLENTKTINTSAERHLSSKPGDYQSSNSIFATPIDFSEFLTHDIERKSSTNSTRSALTSTVKTPTIGNTESINTSKERQLSSKPDDCQSFNSICVTPNDFSEFLTHDIERKSSTNSARSALASTVIIPTTTVTSSHTPVSHRCSVESDRPVVVTTTPSPMSSNVNNVQQDRLNADSLVNTQAPTSDTYCTDCFIDVVKTIFCCVLCETC